MNLNQLKSKIKKLTPQVYGEINKVNSKALEYDELTKFPELKDIIVKLLTSDFDSFLSSIDWVAPRPTTFRINLKNNKEFYLIWMNLSWIAQIEGKKYYLLNFPDEQRAADAIAKILRYGEKVEKPNEEDDDMGMPMPKSPSKPPSGGSFKLPPTPPPDLGSEKI